MVLAVGQQLRACYFAFHFGDQDSAFACYCMDTQKLYPYGKNTA
jgi:hypothetical protein